MTFQLSYNQSNINVFSQLSHTKTKRIFVQPDRISVHLFCSICHQVFQDPVRTACGHTFCYVCIENWAQFQKRCPICKQSTKTRKLQKDLIASQLIDQLSMKCSFEGCSWCGIYSVLKKHQRWCEYKPKKDNNFQVTQADIVQVYQNLSNNSDIQIVQIQGKQYLDIDQNSEQSYSQN